MFRNLYSHLFAFTGPEGKTVISPGLKWLNSFARLRLEVASYSSKGSCTPGIASARE